MGRTGKGFKYKTLGGGWECGRMGRCSYGKT